jgi:hypothetical protein
MIVLVNGVGVTPGSSCVEVEMLQMFASLSKSSQRIKLSSIKPGLERGFKPGSTGAASGINCTDETLRGKIYYCPEELCITRECDASIGSRKVLEGFPLSVIHVGRNGLA